MNRIVKAFIISLALSSFLVAGGFFLIQKIQRSHDLDAFMDSKPAPVLYTLRGQLLLHHSGGSPNGTTQVLRKRLSSECSHLALEKQNDSIYTVAADGIKDRELVKALLTGSSGMQWWELYTLGELFSFLQNADSLLSLSIKKQDTPHKETLQEDTAKASTVEELLRKKSAREVTVEVKDLDDMSVIDKSRHPLSWLLHLSTFAADRNGINTSYPAQLGQVSLSDTLTVNRYLESPVVKAALPADIAFLYGKPYPNTGDPSSFLFLYAIRKTSPKPVLDESFLTEIILEQGRQRNEELVLFHFNQTGASRLERLTTNNINRYIATVSNNEVLSAPKVVGPVRGGALQLNSVIGHEAKLLYLLIKHGPLTAPVTISRLSFAVQPPASPFQLKYLLIWLLAFAVFFALTLYIDKSLRNISRAGRKPGRPVQ